MSIGVLRRAGSPLSFVRLFHYSDIMKVLLVQPPIEDFYDTPIRTYPLGLLYVAARLGDIANVVVLDARTGCKPERFKEHEFHELEPFYKEGIYTPFSFFSHYSRFGLTFTEIKRAVEKERPDVVAVGSMCSAYEKQALEVATAAKEASREIVTVVGGVHPTLFPGRLLSHQDVDYCVRGEGETPFFELGFRFVSGQHTGKEADRRSLLQRTGAFLPLRPECRERHKPAARATISGCGPLQDTQETVHLFSYLQGVSFLLRLLRKTAGTLQEEEYRQYRG